MNKFCESLRGHTIKTINFKKWKDDTFKKRAARIKWKCKTLLYLSKKKLKKYLKDKNTVMLDIILIVLGSIEPCA